LGKQFLLAIPLFIAGGFAQAATYEIRTPLKFFSYENANLAEYPHRGSDTVLVEIPDSFTKINGKSVNFRTALTQYLVAFEKGQFKAETGVPANRVVPTDLIVHGRNEGGNRLGFIKLNTARKIIVKPVHGEKTYFHYQEVPEYLSFESLLDLDDSKVKRLTDRQSETLKKSFGKKVSTTTVAKPKIKSDNAETAAVSGAPYAPDCNCSAADKKSTTSKIEIGPHTNGPLEDTALASSPEPKPIPHTKGILDDSIKISATEKVALGVLSNFQIDCGHDPADLVSYLMEAIEKRELSDPPNSMDRAVKNSMLSMALGQLKRENGGQCSYGKRSVTGDVGPFQVHRSHLQKPEYKLTGVNCNAGQIKAIRAAQNFSDLADTTLRCGDNPLVNAQIYVDILVKTYQEVSTVLQPKSVAVAKYLLPLGYNLGQPKIKALLGTIPKGADTDINILTKHVERSMPRDVLRVAGINDPVSRERIELAHAYAKEVSLNEHGKKILEMVGPVANQRPNNN
jgi:hypothetical protein